MKCLIWVLRRHNERFFNPTQIYAILLFVLKSFFLKGSPLPPFNLTLVCDNPFSITLTWIADFNGGDSQTFHVLSSSGENSTSFKELTSVNDKGYGKTHSYSPAVELYGHLWFRIAASNKFGNSTTGVIPCFTNSKFYINVNVSF